MTSRIVIEVLCTCPGMKDQPDSLVDGSVPIVNCWATKLPDVGHLNSYCNTNVTF